MKSIVKIICIALFLGTVACSKTEAPTKSVEKELQVHYHIDDVFVAGENNSQTKISLYQDNKFSWAKGDTIGVYPSGGTQLYFVANTTSSEGTLFNERGWSFVSGHSYFGYYPFVGDTHLDPSNIPVSFMGQRSDDNIGTHLYMYTQPSKIDDYSLDFDFHHLCCIINLGLVLPSGTYTKLAVTAPSKTFVANGHFRLGASKAEIIGDDFSKQIQLDLGNLTITEGSNRSIYISSAPVNLRDVEITVSVLNVQGKELQCKVTPASNYPAGTLAKLVCDNWKEALKGERLIEDGGEETPAITDTAPCKIHSGYVEPTATTALFTCYFEDNGQVDYGVALSNDGNADLQNWKQTYSHDSHGGIFSLRAYGLSPETQYQYRFFVQTDSTIFFAKPNSFTTPPLSPTFSELNADTKWTETQITFSHDCPMDADISGITYRQHIEDTDIQWQYVDSKEHYDNKYIVCLSPLLPDSEYEIKPFIISAKDTITAATSVIRTKGIDADCNPVDLGLSIKWATVNLGATLPEEAGFYYSWGETTGHHEKDKECCSWEYYSLCEGSSRSMKKYCANSKFGTVDSLITLLPEDDAASVALGGNWRMPTDDEFTELRTECTWTWSSLHEVNGYVVTRNNAAIFMPVTGFKARNGVSLKYGGFYWSSSVIPDSCYQAWRVQFYDTRIIRFRDNRYYGECIRPVHP